MFTQPFILLDRISYCFCHMLLSSTAKVLHSTALPNFFHEAPGVIFHLQPVYQFSLFFCQTCSQLLFCSCITVSSPKDKISISCFQILPVGLLLFKNSATVGCYGRCSSQFKVFMVRVTVASPRNKWREGSRDFQGAISVLL